MYRSNHRRRHAFLIYPGESAHSLDIREIRDAIHLHGYAEYLGRRRKKRPLLIDINNVDSLREDIEVINNLIGIPVWRMTGYEVAIDPRHGRFQWIPTEAMVWDGLPVYTGHILAKITSDIRYTYKLAIGVMNEGNPRIKFPQALPPQTIDDILGQGILLSD